MQPGTRRPNLGVRFSASPHPSTLPSSIKFTAAGTFRKVFHFLLPEPLLIREIVVQNSLYRGRDATNIRVRDLQLAKINPTISNQHSLGLLNKSISSARVRRHTLTTSNRERKSDALRRRPSRDTGPAERADLAGRRLEERKPPAHRARAVLLRAGDAGADRGVLLAGQFGLLEHRPPLRPSERGSSAPSYHQMFVTLLSFFS